MIRLQANLVHKTTFSPTAQTFCASFSAIINHHSLWTIVSSDSINVVRFHDHKKNEKCTRTRSQDLGLTFSHFNLRALHPMQVQLVCHKLVNLSILMAAANYLPQHDHRLINDIDKMVIGN